MSRHSGRRHDRRLPAGHPDRQEGSRGAASSERPPRLPEITMKPARAAHSSRRGHHHKQATPGGLAGLRETLGLLSDLEFSQYLTVRLLPLMYVLLLAASVFLVARDVWQAFAADVDTGLVHLALAPAALLLMALASRIAVEFLLVLFRMSQDVKTLSGIRPAVDRLDSLMSGGSWIARLVKAVQAGRENAPSSSTDHH